MKKLKPYREIINGDKVIIANRDTIIAAVGNYSPLPCNYEI